MYRTVEIDDKVKVRSWESMENEWGLNELGEICIPLSFIRKMRYLCGSEAVVEYKSVSGGFFYISGCYYSISPQMLVGEYEVC